MPIVPHAGRVLLLLVPLIGLLPPAYAADPLPGTQPLDMKGDLARAMVDGIHGYLDKELAAAPGRRDKVQPSRDRLKQILGVIDNRVAPKIEKITVQAPAPAVPLPTEIDGCKISTVRWGVLPAVDAEGLLIEPREAPKSVVVLFGETADLGKLLTAGATLARAGSAVYLPVMTDRRDLYSGTDTPYLKRSTNQPHREFLYRMAYEMGRTPIAYEVQTASALADSYSKDGKPTLPLAVMGHGDGGRAALFTAAVDERFSLALVSGAFGPQENLDTKPIDWNVWSLLKEFGDAEVGSLITPRKLLLDPTAGPTWDGPIVGKPGKGGAAPGKLAPIPITEFDREFARLQKRTGNAAQRVDPAEGLFGTNAAAISALSLNRPAGPSVVPVTVIARLRDYLDGLQAHHLAQRVAHVQKLWRESEPARKAPWAKIDTSSPEAFDKASEELRRVFHEEIIGKLPEASVAPNPKSRVIFDEPKWTGYEVTIDLHPGVFASGILCLPKGMKPGEKRPVVVCQHGLEGRPTDVISPKERSKYYNSFGKRLADLGYIVYAPQNPYIFQNHFRQIQRKANPLKLSLFSFIIAQHKVTLDWIASLPNVDAKRIGFYGLSYGGKTAMRVPAVEKRYVLSICSGDFNEWVGKNVSVDLDRSYMWTGEYEMFEFNLGNTFNYAEMAYLVAPRPFMVERGHDDGVGTDEMVSYEFAKVRYLFANRLKVPDRTTIEYSVGGHEIFLKGTLSFLEQHLGKP